MIEELTASVTTSINKLIEGATVALAPLVSKYIVILSPAMVVIFACMAFTKSIPSIKKSKHHDLIYSILPLVYGVGYTESLKVFGSAMTQPQMLVSGIGFGLLNVGLYKLIKWWKNRKKKKEDKK